MTKNLFFLLAAAFSFIAFCTTDARAQCGSEGLDPCCGNPARMCDKAARGLSIVAEAAIKNKTAIVRTQREKIERKLIRRRQLAKVATSQTSKMLKTIVETDKSSRVLELFPLDGFKPGIAQDKLFALYLDSECGELATINQPMQCYTQNGIHFYFDFEGKSDHLFVSRLRPGGMPGKLENYGFDWDLSYNEWIKLFQGLGYKTLATEKPRVSSYAGIRYFDAELTTIVKTNSGKMLLTLNFANGFGRTARSDRETLFSITIDRNL